MIAQWSDSAILERDKKKCVAPVNRPNTYKNNRGHRGGRYSGYAVDQHHQETE